MDKKRVVITGGSGKAGNYIVKDLIEQGYEVLNIDITPMKDSAARTLITDITDAGQVFNALSSYTGKHELDPSIRPKKIDAVVHLAAIPRILSHPDNEIYRINVMGTYNILDAASKLGINKVIFASSETTYGLVFAHEHRNPVYFPLDEEYPVDPMDSYAMSKIINEITAKAFHARTGMDIYGFRIGNVIEPNEYDNFPEFFKDPSARKRIAWSYIDVRDLAQACRLGLETDGLGFEIMNVTADDVSSNLPTMDLLKTYYPDVPIKKELSEYETLLSNKKIKKLLGFKPEHAWRRYLNQ
ncbi:UDP-glucose 4-epimerase [Halalkalibacter wakoensis JCM 9140]|uniref:UDP-glucose 4-epimerase n=1 Tax=Halalkalibacter wakoensis JCM 9140 TaxID=1236970 RepID=W4Q9K6_9BACI|nr:NAD(P)-dependent oxidoreductase [Halalkalibacter wakoensis]GAE28069.1 UDP-glucose 4-epimerase [Halalkalibacter wakoensis JCM 9140]